MSEQVMRLYRSGQLTPLGLARAVALGWLTGEEYTALTGEAYVSPAGYVEYYAAMKEAIG